MKESLKRAVIFDLDGTLWDSTGQIYKIWNQVFERHHDLDLRISQNETKALMGKTWHEIAAILFPDRDDSFRKVIIQELGDEETVYLREHGGELFEGLRETVDRLKADYELFIVSNCQAGYVEAFLEAHGFLDDFKDIEMSGRTGKEKGDNILLLMERNHVRKAVYVGDATGDEQAARYAGIPFIYAAYGFGEAVCPDRVVQSLAELPDVLDDILPFTEMEDRGV